ncbi:MAG: hypothetical protein NWE92_05815 [Candidatus Bathyarchaeota archaeon]|nr:hypothetical protein [Candidatus Bathyarchaeota archaeon]
MTLVFLGILNNDAIYTYPELLDKVVNAVILSAISCCIAWGVVDGIFYAWEQHSLVSRKNLITSYTKNDALKSEGLEMIAEDLEDGYVSILDDTEKSSVGAMVFKRMADYAKKERVPVKDDLATIFLDMGLNLGACLIILLPLILLRNVVAVYDLVNVSFITAIVLMFIIGVWVETRKSWRFKIRKGGLYAMLGFLITLLTWFLGG